MANRLAQETSPYLLQHAENPVDWHPWGDEALALAKREDKPILLSIGYSACHWCHVMERESFEDAATAERMNAAFVNIKVDREERPDLDSVYMKAVQAMTGQGGWPLTAFLTPGGVPYFGGTYFPPAPRHGMPSFHQVLDAALAAYRDRREEVLQAGSQLTKVLSQSSWEAHEGQGTGADFSEKTIDDIVAFAQRSYDPAHGGFGGAPKFPQPVFLDFLLRSGSGRGTNTGVDMATHTLSQMARGGMRDQLGGGFHRYAVDAKWLVPHFEKMLYDNALLARTYASAGLVTGDDSFGTVAVEILDDMISDMGAPEGPFYSARDADSEGEEGTFYLWTPEELREVLDGDTARLFSRVYDVSSAGNFEGKNILHLPHDLDAVARDEGLSRTELNRTLADAAIALKARREEREAPLLDDKILTSWNGMTIRALAEVGAAMGRPDFTRRGLDAATFLFANVQTQGALSHVYGGGRAYVNGFLEDYAALGNACVSLYEATLDPRWIGEAEVLAEGILDRFWTEKDAVFHDTATGSTALVVRPRDIMDNATPSGNSLAVEFLLRLGATTGAQRWTEAPQRVLEREMGVLERYPTAVGRLAVAGILAYTPKLEVTLVGATDGPHGSRIQEMLDAAHGHFHPNRLIAGGDPVDPLISRLPVLEGRTQLGGNAFVCRGSSCLEPVDSGTALADQLRGI